MNSNNFLLLCLLSISMTSLCMDNDLTYDLSTLPAEEWYHAQELLCWAKQDNQIVFAELMNNRKTQISANIRYEVLRCGNVPINDNITQNMAAYKKVFSDNIHKQLSESEDISLIRLLLIHGANVNQKKRGNDYVSYPVNFLVWAIKQNNASMVQLLLSHPLIDPNRKCGKLQPIMYALKTYPNTQIFELLLKSNKLDINRAGQDGNTVLHYAASYGKINIVKLLLEHPDVNPDLLNNSGSAAIFCANDHHHYDVVDLLQQKTNFFLTPTYFKMRNFAVLLSAFFVHSLLAKK